MVDDSFEWKYTLNRRQRLVPHLHVWGMHGIVLCVLVSAVIAAGCNRSGWGFLALIPLGLMLRGFFVGLLDVVVNPTRDMDIIVQGNGLGFLADGERLWIFLDGIVRITQFQHDTWTILHWNGTVINVPSAIATGDQLEYLRSASERGRTKAGVQEAVERGRRIVEIERQSE